jgi:putative FmdB family regulatory protein
MPIYEFVCKPCDRRFEVLTTISRASETTCPVCGSGKVKRVMSMFSARSAGGNSSDSSSLGGDNCAGCAAGHCSSCGHG